MRKSLFLPLLLLACDASTSEPSTKNGKATPAVKSESVRKALLAAYESAGDWLVGQQDASGSWKQKAGGEELDSPAYTALIVTALAKAPEPLKAKYKEPVEKGVKFIAGKANLDGSFGEGPTGAFLKTYATALALMALATTDPDAHANLIRGAHAYIKQNQMREGLHRGGVGYGDESPKVIDGQLKIRKKTYANLASTGFAAEGLKQSGLPQSDEFWQLVVEYVRKCQNNSEVNTDAEYLSQLKAQGLQVGDDGGLYYVVSADRTMHKAGTRKLADKEMIVSYGAMTYDGIKTYIYAGLRKDSPEVRSAIDWVRKNYTVEAHPGFAYDKMQRHHLRGLYYYLLVMAKALHVFGETPFETFDGKKHDWPKEIAVQLVKTVRGSKMWQNDNPAWYEGDSILVTSYVLNICDIILPYLK